MNVARLLRMTIATAAMTAISMGGIGQAPQSAQATTPPKGADADLVIVLPALDRATFAKEKTLILPWLRHQRLSYKLVPLWRVLAGRPAPSLTAEDFRQYLRQHFT